MGCASSLHPGGAPQPPLPARSRGRPSASDPPFSASLQGAGAILGRPRRLASPKRDSSGKGGTGGARSPSSHADPPRGAASQPQGLRVWAGGERGLGGVGDSPPPAPPQGPWGKGRGGLRGSPSDGEMWPFTFTLQCHHLNHCLGARAQGCSPAGRPPRGPPPP